MGSPLGQGPFLAAAQGTVLAASVHILGRANKVLGERYAQQAKVADKFLALAEKNPKDAVAVDALLWVLSNVLRPSGDKENARTKAVALLLRDHAQSNLIGPVCGLLTMLDKESESVLRTLLEKNPHRDVQGQACLALGQLLNNRLIWLRTYKDRLGIAKAYEMSVGKDHLKEVEAQAAATDVKEAESLFERAVRKYADVRIPLYGTVGEKAKSELFEIRNLKVGQMAPEIEGDDQHGQQLKLSDYRGKVVLLDFFSFN